MKLTYSLLLTITFFYKVNQLSFPENSFGEHDDVCTILPWQLVATRQATNLVNKQTNAGVSQYDHEENVGEISHHHQNEHKETLQM